jgi:hypothetical protein
MSGTAPIAVPGRSTSPPAVKWYGPRTDDPTMRRAPSLVALLVALAGVAVLGAAIAVELRRAVPAEQPRTAIERATAEREQARLAALTARDRSWDVAFDDGMVRDRVEWSSPGYPDTVDLSVVNATPGVDLRDTARACLRAQGRSARVQCYVFASTEAYEFKDVSGELRSGSPGPIANLCYAARATNERAGGAATVIGVAELRDFSEKFGCPRSWAGPAGGAR